MKQTFIVLSFVSMVALATPSPRPSLRPRPLPSPTPTPLVLPSPIIYQKSFGKLWIRSIVINAPSPNQEASAQIVLYPEVTKTGELAPDSTAIHLSIPNIFGRIRSGDKQLGQLMQHILAYAQKEKVAEGK